MGLRILIAREVYRNIQEESQVNEDMEETDVVQQLFI
ncbi:hypothetical protein FF38_10705 [Lucilia cuprina]|uniref:Uncharacterized protein n=1 Tax=Lucilia cuprina TaxID=7375 RepID=A0A0L0CLS4_LUCCU|nr:hypothetical protein FF38_10705 [Lucilia cuprina]